MIKGLTKRRQQFLDMMVDLYQRTKLPIHYETLGKALGVSKWTAYDMMKEIEKLGFISRTYVTNSKETGRSQVMFTPTAKAFDLFAQAREKWFSSEKWQHTIAEIARSLEKVNEEPMEKAIHELMAKISGTDNQVDFCSSILGLLVAYLKKSGQRTEEMVRRLVRMAPAQNNISLFVGTIFGMVVQSMNEKMSPDVADMLSRFLQIVDDLSEQEKRMIADFLLETM